MSLILNGTKINPTSIVYNGVELTEIICNGLCVWPDFDTSLLQDFEYTDNGNGTYTITAWKGTCNGAASTDCILPDSHRVII